MWWSKTKRLMILYLVSGAWFAPAGLIYALLVLSRHDSILAALFILAIASVPAFRTWRYFEARLSPAQPVILFVPDDVAVNMVTDQVFFGPPLAVCACYIVIAIAPLVRPAVRWHVNEIRCERANQSLAQSAWVSIDICQ